MKGPSGVCSVVTITILFVSAGLAPAVLHSGHKVDPPRPPIILDRAEVPAERASLLDELRAAKREGDEAAVGRLHAQLGWPGTSTPANAARPGPRMVIREDRLRDPLKWGGDVQVNDPHWMSGYQDMACAGDGTFYVVVVDMSSVGYLDVYLSADGGVSWQYDFSIIEGDRFVYYPSIAIGEGVRDRLLVAYEVGRNTADAQVVVFWRELDGSDYGAVTVDSHPNSMVGHPKICVDSPEYSVWYAYLSYVKSVTATSSYDQMYCRTIDYGDSWEAPLWLNTGTQSEDDHAIDFGAAGLYIAWCQYNGSANGLLMANTTDFGNSWIQHALGATPLDESEPSIAVANTGDTTVVAFAVNYGGSDIDMEAWVIHEGTWSYVYLPYNAEFERGSDLAYDPATDTIQAAYVRTAGVVVTQADRLAPTIWSTPLRVNEQQTAAQNRCAIAADPTGVHGVGVAWMDFRDPDQIDVYFDASILTNPRAVDYLMICPDALLEPAAALAHYRELRGYGVQLVTLSQIGPAPQSAVSIDLFIEEYAEAAPQLRFLALVGDVALLPGFYVDDGSAQWYSDLRYADTDGDFLTDYLADVAVGRIPVRDADELWEYFAKVKIFEQTYRGRNKVVFFGDTAEMSYVANRDSAVVANRNYDVVALREPSEAQLFAALNDPAVAMVLYYGHGSFANNWPLHVGNLDAWTNIDSPVLYFSGGCEFHDNTLVNPPLGHELLFAPGCAATATGATVNGGYGYNYEYIHALLLYSWYYTTAGELHKYALWSHHGAAAAAGQDVSLGSWVQFFTGRMMCHGDPALRIDGDVTAVPEGPVPRPRLAQNYPNPFNPRTTIRFELPVRAEVKLGVFDLLGRKVRTLLDGAPRDAGRHELTWDGRDDRGVDVPSGVYVYRLSSGRVDLSGKMALMR